MFNISEHFLTYSTIFRHIWTYWALRNFMGSYGPGPGPYWALWARIDTCCGVASETQTASWAVLCFLPKNDIKWANAMQLPGWLAKINRFPDGALALVSVYMSNIDRKEWTNYQIVKPFQKCLKMYQGGQHSSPILTAPRDNISCKGCSSFR